MRLMSSRTSSRAAASVWAYLAVMLLAVMAAVVFLPACGDDRDILSDSDNIDVDMDVDIDTDMDTDVI